MSNDLSGKAALIEATERQRRVWDRRARKYDRGMRLMERLLLGDGRAQACAQAKGEVLEVAIGTGRNLPYYPEGVRLTGIELSQEMLAIARRRADALGQRADLRQGDAQALPFPDATFDCVVCTLALCSIPNDRQAVAEMKRVLHPGGRLLLLDHVPSTVRVWHGLQWLLEQLTLRVEGEHLLRRPLELVLAEGFEVERAERAKAGIIERVTARKPLPDSWRQPHRHGRRLSVQSDRSLDAAGDPGPRVIRGLIDAGRAARAANARPISERRRAVEPAGRRISNGQPPAPQLATRGPVRRLASGKIRANPRAPRDNAWVFERPLGQNRQVSRKLSGPGGAGNGPQECRT
jgi:ubiquinone/menaquinone biosynthesis C-methylase UbiE